MHIQRGPWRRLDTGRRWMALPLKQVGGVGIQSKMLQEIKQNLAELSVQRTRKKLRGLQ